MPKKSVVNRNAKRKQIALRFRAKRDQLRKIISDIHLTPEERWNAMIEMQDLPRDSSRSRYRNRCMVCGRSRAYNRLTGLCRLHMRKTIVAAMVPGMRKASW